MKISFDNTTLQKLQSANRTYTSDSTYNLKGTDLSIDITATLTDNNTYGSKGMSVSEFRDTLKSKDVQVSQDYMTVMSNSMSEEDFAKLVKKGGRPESVSVEDSVTIIDKIKLAVARSGQDIKGFTDTLDSETIEKMTGLKTMEAAAGEYDITLSESMCNDIKDASDKMKEVTDFTEGMKKDFVIADKVPTIDSLYRSYYSNVKELHRQGSSYFSIETPGYLAKKGDMGDTEALKGEVTDLLLNVGIEADVENVEDGMWLLENSIPVNEENLEKLKEIKAISLPMKDEDISKAIAIALSEGKEPGDAVVTAKENIYEKAVNITKELADLVEKPFIKATRMLEETRLKMTFEANLLLLKSNYHIDTKDMEGYVEALKNLENSDEFKEASLAVETETVVEEVKALPLHVMGTFAKSINTVSLEAIHKEGTAIKAKLEMAGVAYEQVGTEVRKDLGDSIKKAFRNIPEILKSMGIENTEENNRAVRILGYNSMPITKESFEEIREADRKLQSVLTRLSPQDTLALIRENKSPIKMSVEELNEYLDSKEDSDVKEMEKYSRFLYKLERDKDITPEERKDYIEVYRFINQMEKSGYAAVGAVVNEKREFSFGNLRTAYKSAKHKGMDVTVGEVFNKIVNPPENDSLEADWISHRFQQMREALNAPEQAVTELVMNELPVTAENLQAALALREKRGEAFKKATKADGGRAKEKALSFSDKLDNKPAAVFEYSEMASECKKAVFNECMASDNYIDVRALQLVHRQLTVATGYASHENYEVPMEIGGQVTSVNVKLVHNSSEMANAVISLETEELGKVTAKLYKQEKEITGYITCNLKNTVNKMTQVVDKLGKKISVLLTNNSDTELSLSRIPVKDNDESVSSRELYDIAKEFLKDLKGL